MHEHRAPRPARPGISALGGLIAALLLVLSWVNTATADRDRRIALVIGNSGYQSVAKIPNAANDARLMASTLSKLGFKLVGDGAQIDVDKARFDSLIREFGARIGGVDVALFYYAGHGMQIRGSNFLVPITANPVRETDVDFQMVDTQLVLRQMEAGNTKLNMLILDACRNNPFGGRGLRSVPGGLAQMVAPLGTLISYATQPGNVAADGTDGDSPYTKALVDAMQVPGRGLFDVFNQVGLAVKASTGGSQQPWVSSSPIEGQFFFVPPGSTVTIQTPPTNPSVPAPPAAGPDAELLFWQTIVASRDPADFKAYLDQYPQGRFAALARPRAVSPPAPPLGPPPAPPPASNTDTGDANCDTLAASPGDTPLPTGVRGVAIDKLDTRAAIPACERSVANRPTPRQQFQLARSYDVARRDEDAVRLYKLAVAQGYAAAQVNLANMYSAGRGGLPKDDNEAIRLQRLAAAQGFAIAQFNLGVMYEKGRGSLRKDETEAARLYGLAAAQGYPAAQTSLGLMYETGRGGLSKDLVEAVHYYKLAAAQGCAPAQTDLGFLYESGSGGLPKSDTEAVRLYELAAAQGFARAQTNLGFMHEFGRGGLPKNDAEAVRLYKLAAAQGIAVAQTNLAYMYEAGRGGLPKDDVEAVRLYKQAAAQGQPRAQANLGVMYEYGRGGLTRNKAEAIRLYRLAADQNFEFAKAALRRLGLQ